ncbi:hypothetical protein Terro_2506 [Terriglobus roseus DSM 18391]|uniref:Phage baseplate protein n=1 Tax=Terriglobus roseus (strain DSM 18391 / NRRL B-41598 / KBS 63) TaxID=926566 RepID=I3ZGP4_TERRK|nr:hypothetical protein [Terriglobus roseus]AFL88412.1 hypothetical protein Terro_2142 [Terriglobus roseus DSM 18391]AFL88753.1 hypothetical protein Terro_2506 [Terriglobus roseus DSM 18391]
MESSAGMVVRAWEAGSTVTAWQRPAALLSALTDIPLQQTLRLGIARRDAALVAWRTALFGVQWPAFAQCPACKTMLEYELPQRSATVVESDEALEIDVSGLHLQVRWPNSLDLADAAACPDAREGRALLLKRILPEPVAEDFVGSVLTAMADAHNGFTGIDLQCPECAAHWSEVFEAGEYLWREVRAAGRRILRDVDALARAYGWSETEILSLSDLRRNEYLAMVP